MSKKGSLAALLELVEQDLEKHSVILSTNGQLERFNTVVYKSFDEFMYASSYYTSWSNALVFGEMIMKKTHDIVLNDLFPHTSVLMALSNKSSFIIDDRKLFDIQKYLKRWT